MRCAILRHYFNRLSWCARDPLVIAAMLVSVAVSFLFFWLGLTLWEPLLGTTEQKLTGWLNRELPIQHFFLTFGYTIFWPALPIIAIKGRLSNTFSSLNEDGHSLPTLPIGAKTRHYAEILVAITYLVLIRLICLAIAPWPVTLYLSELFWGLLLTTPFMLIWSKSATWNTTIKLTIVSLTLLISSQLGLLSTPLSYLLTTTILFTISVLLLEIDFVTGKNLASKPLNPRKLFRIPKEPKVQIRRDALAMFGLKFGPWLASLLAIGLMIAGISYFLPVPKRFAILILSACGVVLMGASFYPFGLNLIVKNMRQKKSHSVFLKAWSTLPIEPFVVLRTSYFHMIFTLFCGYLFIVFGVMISLYMKTGVILVNENGEFVGWFLLSLLAVVPNLAGVILSHTISRGKPTWLCLVSIYVFSFLSIGSQKILSLTNLDPWLSVPIMFGLAVPITIWQIKYLFGETHHNYSSPQITNK